ncbi:histidinol dehydrogenase [Sporosarcina sp. Te-1]|uniref:histidinol dehydrogenase n=1 Tax=Sporosarcina sp. Te-1 TaxID=2818390 RepID=UPI001A9F279F|nr:histidinol dehydrogenase [Sporosarcina sp. Te-1]QTD41305.1 histidinol dehydrogenase [Sporosarcina sp. Te-1]
MRIIDEQQFWKEREQRQGLDWDSSIDQTVLGIIQDVRRRGDEALREMTKKFDGADVQELVVSSQEFEKARSLLSRKVYASLEKAKRRIEAFHSEQKERSWIIQQEDGVLLGQMVTPIERVGIYIPGGKAAYPSTVLMNAIPAKLAGVQHLAMATPPRQDGKVEPAVLVAAEIAGVDQVYKVGGAQAIAAFAYGTETVKKVAKITGPGNSYVARAKKWVFGDVAIDMIAGPSEVCIVADRAANPVFAAADLLAQAEHDERAAVTCVTTSRTFAEQLSLQVTELLRQMERGDIAHKSIDGQGRIIVVDTLTAALEIVNHLAPEHLQMMVENPMEQLPAIRNAGAIFIGPYSPEALGDYMAGPNHTLPTNGTAAFSSPLGVYDFMKKSSLIRFSEKALDDVAEDIIRLAEVEGLTGHAQSIRVREGSANAD